MGEYRQGKRADDLEEGTTVVACDMLLLQLPEVGGGGRNQHETGWGGGGGKEGRRRCLYSASLQEKEGEATSNTRGQAGGAGIGTAQLCSRRGGRGFENDRSKEMAETAA
jgi:hypothetical protein